MVCGVVGDGGQLVRGWVAGRAKDRPTEQGYRCLWVRMYDVAIRILQVVFASTHVYTWYNIWWYRLVDTSAISLLHVTYRHKSLGAKLQISEKLRKAKISKHSCLVSDGAGFAFQYSSRCRSRSYFAFLSPALLNWIVNESDSMRLSRHAACKITDART